MSAIEEAIRLVSEPPGSLVYHLTLLFSLWAALLVCGPAWRRARVTRVGALAVTAGVLLLIRGAQLAAAVLATQGLLNPDIVLPPLDRAAGLAALSLFAWSIGLARHSRQTAVALSIAGFFILIGYVASATFWASQVQAGYFYNGTDQETGWELAAFVALGLGLIVSAWQRPPDWGLGLGLFGLLALGHILHYAFPLPASHIAGAERLAELAAFPIFAVIALRAASDDDALSRARPALRVKAAPALEKQATAADPQLIGDLAALAATDATADLGPAIARAAARALRADICMIVVPDSGRITATLPFGYDLIREQVMGGRSLSLHKTPALASALQRGKAVRLSSERHAGELAELSDVLNAGQPGPAMIVPLEKSGHNLGSLLVFSPYSKHVWTPEDQYLLTGLAGAMTSALLRHEALADLDQKYQATAARLDEATRLLIQTQAQVDRLTQALDEARARIALEHEQARVMATAQGQSGDAAMVQEMRQQLADLQSRLRETQAQATDLEHLRAELAQARAAAAQAEGLRHELAENTALLARLQPAHGELQSNPVLLEAELRQARAENARLREQLESAEVQGSRGSDREVVSSITQDLRQPMSSILGYTDLLLGESVGILGALQRKFLERVKVSTERMGALLDDLIRVTAIDAGTLELAPETVDIAGVIDDAITGSSAQFREKNITLRMDIAEDLPLLNADRDAMSQVMTHLLSNAANASPTDGEVLVRAQHQVENFDGREAGFLLVSVTDSGAGIGETDRQRVFTRMYRADNPLIEGLGETGVGLSIVKALVEAHGGRIWVDSERDVGSTFSLLLPVEAERVGNGTGPQ